MRVYYILPQGIIFSNYEKENYLDYEKGDIFAEIPNSLHEELFEVIVNKGSTRIERIVSKGHSSPKNFWYKQKEDEFVILLSGSATILFKESGKEEFLEPGDYLIIPAFVEHKVISTNPHEESVWLALFY